MNFQITNSLEEANVIRFEEGKKEWGVNKYKFYEIIYGVIDEAIGEEYYIIDDYGRKNVAALLCIKGTLYKTNENEG